MPPGNLARTGLLETLGRTLVGFHLGHNSVLILFELGIPLGSVAATKTLKRLTGASQPAEQRLDYSMPSHPGPFYEVRVIHSFVSPNLSISNETLSNARLEVFLVSKENKRDCHDGSLSWPCR